MLLIMLLGLLFTIVITSTLHLIKDGAWYEHLLSAVLLFVGFLLSGYIQQTTNKTFLGFEALPWFASMTIIGTLLNIFSNEKAVIFWGYLVILTILIFGYVGWFIVSY